MSYIGYDHGVPTEPQVRTVYNHLLRTGTITRVEAEATHKVRHLPHAINILRNECGLNIRTEFRQDVSGQRYARYFLDYKNAPEASARPRRNQAIDLYAMSNYEVLDLIARATRRLASSMAEAA